MGPFNRCDGGDWAVSKRIRYGCNESVSICEMTVPRVGPTYHNWHNEFYRGAIVFPELLTTEMSVIISGGTAYSTIRAGLNGRR